MVVVRRWFSLTTTKLFVVRRIYNVFESIRMKVSDLREKTEDQLVEELSKFKKEAFNLRFQKATGQLENTARVRFVRRSIARISTIITDKATQGAK